MRNCVSGEKISVAVLRETIAWLALVSDIQLISRPSKGVPTGPSHSGISGVILLCPPLLTVATLVQAWPSVPRMGNRAASCLRRQRHGKLIRHRYNCYFLTCFSELDATHGYFQLTSALTIFLCPSGRYCYLRATMGLSASSGE